MILLAVAWEYVPWRVEKFGLFRDYFLCIVLQDADMVHSEREELNSRADHL